MVGKTLKLKQTARPGPQHPLHPQVRVRHGRRWADVDERIAPLVLELWRAGINTVASCQSWSGVMDDKTGVIATAKGGYVWLAFPVGEGNVARFKKITRRMRPRFRNWRFLFHALGSELWFRPERLTSLLACLRRHNAKAPRGSRRAPC